MIVTNLQKEDGYEGTMKVGGLRVERKCRLKCLLYFECVGKSPT